MHISIFLSLEDDLTYVPAIPHVYTGLSEQQIKEIYIFADHVIFDTTISCTVAWMQFGFDVKHALKLTVQSKMQNAKSSID